MTEFSTFWAEQTQLFVAPAAEENTQKRALAVLQWYICTLKQQYGKRDRKGKKPLNPFLGEIFLGHFQDEQGRTELVAEQVSHHPPVTAYHIWNTEKGVHMHGYNAQKTYFSGTVRIDKIGFVILHLDNYDEDYLITLPKMHLEGLVSLTSTPLRWLASFQKMTCYANSTLVSASSLMPIWTHAYKGYQFPPPPYPELEGETYIQSSSGYTSVINYSGKGWLRGKKNSFAASLFKTGEAERPLYVMEGQWQNGPFDIKNMPSKKLLDTYSTENYPLTPLEVVPVEKQDPLESRRAWHKVAQAIEEGDMTTVSKEKSRIEEEQRAMRKTEKLEGTEWFTRYFTKVNKWPILEKLANEVGVDMQLESTKGIWKWDDEKYAKIKSST